MNVNVYQHFRKEEHPFVEQVNDWINQVNQDYSPVTTTFLNPRQAFIVKTLVGSNGDVKVSFFGGYEASERNRAIIYPDYFSPTQADYDICLVKISYPTKFSTLSHGQILGSLMSTGLKREYFGDIITDGLNWQFLVQNDKLNYVMTQVDRIARVKVNLTELDFEQILISSEEWFDDEVTVSSLRLDNVISTVYNVSRQQAKLLVESSKVKVNWLDIPKINYLLETLDVISVRGFGRIQIMEITGRTKKDKIRIKIKKIKK